MPKKPITYTTDSDVANLISTRLAILADRGQEQKDVAVAMGYDKPNVVTMFKSGATRVPLNRAPACAIALGVDPLQFLMMCLKEYKPEIYDVFEPLLREKGVSTEAAYRIAKRVDAIAAEEKLLLAPERITDADLDAILKPLLHKIAVSVDGVHHEAPRKAPIHRDMTA